MRTLKQLAIESLTHLQENGQGALAIDEDARRILRGWMSGARQRSNEPPEETQLNEDQCGKAFQSSPCQLQCQQSDRPIQKAPPQGMQLRSAEEKLEFLRAKAQNWKAARKLGSLRDTMVFATGNPHARLMFVGEAPGYDEERLAEPFVGRAGQKLNQILTAMKLAREDVYISNVCKFRPSMGTNQGTANRPPSDAEIAACLPLILAEIRAISPGCIVCLGGSSAKGLLGSACSVSSLRGRWLDCQGIPVRVTYHPSYLLRNESLKAKRAVWEDMLAVMELLGMPISPRQQHYFLGS